jgi:hypothetical protein
MLFVSKAGSGCPYCPTAKPEKPPRAENLTQVAIPHEKWECFFLDQQLTARMESPGFLADKVFLLHLWCIIPPAIRSMLLPSASVLPLFHLPPIERPSRERIVYLCKLDVFPPYLDCFFRSNEAGDPATVLFTVTGRGRPATAYKEPWLPKPPSELRQRSLRTLRGNSAHGGSVQEPLAGAGM